jgi:trigger factor
MQVEVNDVNSYTKKITVKIDPSELKEVENQAVNKIKKNTSIPGFRKGRVPVGLIKQRFGENIKMEVMENAISQFYGKALDQTKINPINQGKIDNLQFDKIEDGMEFEIEIEVEPEIELKKYKGLKVEKEVSVVTESMKEKVINNLREQFATVKELEESKEGDFITFDAQLLGDGDMPVIGRKFEDIYIKIGSGEFDKEFEKELVGLNKDQEKIIRKTNEPKSKKEKPQIESYKISVKSIQEKNLPPLDNDFIQNLQDDSIKTLDQLKERIDINLKTDVEKRSKEQFVSRLIDELLKENPFDAPDSMVEHYLEHLVEDIKNQSKGQGGQEVDEEGVRKNYRAYAIHNIRWHLIKKKIIELEKIEVDQKEINDFIDKMNFEEKQKKELKANPQFKHRIREDLLEQKVINLLESNADIVEIYPQEKTESKKAEEFAEETK